MAIKTSNQITFTEQKKVEKIEEWYLATSHDSDVTTEDGDWGIWSQEIQIINADKPYLWNYEKVIYSIGDPEISNPIIIGFYGKGSDGKSIVNIKNYYQLTTDTNPPTLWQEKVPMLDSVNRYLWNYEEIIYSTGEPTKTDPAIIGVYGDSGTDSVNFQIYSVDGFEFNEDLTSIELKTIAFKGGKPIESDSSYVWESWNTISQEYEAISGATNSTLIVNVTDNHAFTSIKCKMTYEDKTYEDYVSLTEKNTVYTSNIKFFNGTNVFKNTDKYIIAYMALYKNGEEIDLLQSNQFANATSVDDSGVITTTITGTFENGQLLYFILPDETYKTIYNVVLGRYDGTNWNSVSITQDYLYENSKSYNNLARSYSESAKIMVISKEEVNKTLAISFNAYKKSDCSLLSTADGNVIDLNDPIVGGVEPSNPINGQLWVDTSRSPYVVKTCKIDVDGNIEWTDVTQQFGGVVHTSKPSSYSINDVWILNDNEYCSYTTSNPLLPDGYSQLEYIESTGAQYIDTGVVPNQDTKLEIDIAFLGSKGDNIAGVRNSTSDTINRFGLVSFSSASKIGAFFGSASIQAISFDNNRHTYSLSESGLNVDGTLYSGSGGSFSCTYNIVLFGWNNGSSGVTKTKSRIYSCKIYDNDVLVRNFIPCTNSNGAAGLYCLETNTFYVNQGTGAFTTGSKVASTVYNYGPGSMLRSSANSNIFVASHWSEIKSELTDMRDNVAQYFEFNSETGLKIGQKDQKFYVNISATEMGFYDNSNSNKPNEKVVSIGNQAAKIKNITVEESAIFNCDADFNNSINIYNPYKTTKVGFAWKIETDGSLSLVVIQ